MLRGSLSRARLALVAAVLAVLAVTVLTGLGACTGGPVGGDATSGPLAPGLGRFEVDVPGGRKLPVYYAVGDGVGAPGAGAPTLLFVMHGVNRNAADYRETWVPLVEGRNVVVVAPEFSEKQFPGVAAYNLGGLRAGQAPDPEGAFAAMPAVIDGVTSHFGLAADTPFDLFGHSAGAQFVHRYVEFAATSRLRHAVAANAGWYTMPDEKSEFPYGFGGVEGARAPASLFASRLTVLLGGDDVEDENLRTRPDAMRQGATRLERGFSFYGRARAAASAAQAPLAWDLHVVPGVGHDQESMAKAAAPLLLGS